MKIALLTTDNREDDRQYDLAAPYFGTAPAALLQGFAALPEAEVHVLSCTQRLLASPPKLADNIWFHSLQVPKRGWLRTGYQGCIRAVRQKLREIQPEIVHGQGTERDCSLTAIFSGFPNVITIHGNMRSLARVNRVRPFSFPWLAARLEAFTLPRTHGVICITNFTRAAVAGLARRTWLVPNAVDQGLFALNPKPDLAHPPTGLCVGTICPLKNQNTLIRELDPLAEKTRFKLIFAGKPAAGEYAREFYRLIQTRPWCEAAGFLNRDQLREQLQRASFLVLPSFEDNCPMVVLEAMAAGVPVAASNVGGVPDLITPESNGLLCDPQKPATFRDSVARLLHDPELAKKLADRAKAGARRRFHPEMIARQHLEIYREVLQSRT